MKVFLAISFLLNIVLISRFAIKKWEHYQLKQADFITEYQEIKQKSNKTKNCIYFYSSKLNATRKNSDLNYLYQLSLLNKSCAFVISDLDAASNSVFVTSNFIITNNKVNLYHAILHKLKMQLLCYPMTTIVKNDSIILNHTTGNISNIAHAFSEK